MNKYASICGLFFMTACGASQNPGTLSQASQEPASRPLVRAEEIPGRYALLIRYASAQRLPIVGVVKTVGDLFKIADIEPEGEGYSITERNCRLAFDGGARLDLTFSDAGIQAAPAVKGSFSVSQDEEGGALRFARGPFTQVFGAQLDDPMLDPLPGSRDDPRVVDLEGDGKPGASASVRAFVISGTLDYILRTTDRYEGLFTASGVGQGLIKHQSDGVILDVSNFLLRPAIGPFNFNPDPEAAKSRVLLVKVPEDASCASVDWASLGAVGDAR